MYIVLYHVRIRDIVLYYVHIFEGSVCIIYLIKLLIDTNVVLQF